MNQINEIKEIWYKPCIKQKPNLNLENMKMKNLKNIQRICKEEVKREKMEEKEQLFKL